MSDDGPSYGQTEEWAGLGDDDAPDEEALAEIREAMKLWPARAALSRAKAGE